MVVPRMRELIISLSLYSVLVTPDSEFSVCIVVKNLRFGSRQSCVRIPDLSVSGSVILYVVKSLCLRCFVYKMFISQ